MYYDSKDQILAVINGDPGLPYITFIDVSGINARTSNCQPMIPGTPYGPPLGNALGPINAPSCILGQIYYDAAGPVRQYRCGGPEQQIWHVRIHPILK